jgi:3-oxoacyl-[acyl-carrier protein] reductase
LIIKKPIRKIYPFFFLIFIIGLSFTKKAKTAIITGGSRGIGKETAILLAKKEKINVVVCSTSQSQINAITIEINKILDKENEKYKNNSNNNNNETRVLGLECDVTISSDVDHLVNTTLSKFGSIDILVNNAGVAFNKKIINTSEEEWNKTMNTNLKGPFLFTKAILPYMIKNNYGTIVNVNSGAGKYGFENLSAYCASKFGLMGFAKSLALEVAAYNIRVLTICPGEVATRMWQDFDYTFYKLNRDKMLKPQKVAERILEMIFDTKSYENGKIVDIYSR